MRYEYAKFTLSPFAFLDSNTKFAFLSVMRRTSHDPKPPFFVSFIILKRLATPNHPIVHSSSSFRQRIEHIPFLVLFRHVDTTHAKDHAVS